MRFASGGVPATQKVNCGEFAIVRNRVRNRTSRGRAREAGPAFGVVRQRIGLILVSPTVEVIVVKIEVAGAFAFGEDEFAELIVDLGIEG